MKMFCIIDYKDTKKGLKFSVIERIFLNKKEEIENFCCKLRNLINLKNLRFLKTS